MFYEIDIPCPAPEAKQARALVVLNPAESRRLLAKATAACAEVKQAWQTGTIIIGRGITNAYVTEELFGITIEPKAAQTAGLVVEGITNANSGPPPCTWHVIREGKAVEGADSNVEILDFGPGNVFIKGANAVDGQGNAGVYVASLKGGTIGMAWPIVMPRRCDLIIPVSLEKMVFSVLESAKHTGVYYYQYSTGIPVTLIPVPMAKVITEIEAVGILAGVRAFHVGSGGVGGSEGSVHLSLEGEEGKVERAFELIKSIKGEPAVTLSQDLYVSSAADYEYDPQAQLETLGGM